MTSRQIEELVQKNEDIAKRTLSNLPSVFIIQEENELYTVKLWYHNADKELQENILPYMSDEELKAYLEGNELASDMVNFVERAESDRVYIVEHEWRTKIGEPGYQIIGVFRNHSDAVDCLHHQRDIELTESYYNDDYDIELDEEECFQVQSNEWERYDDIHINEYIVK